MLIVGVTVRFIPDLVSVSKKKLSFLYRLFLLYSFFSNGFLSRLKKKKNLSISNAQSQALHTRRLTLLTHSASEESKKKKKKRQSDLTSSSSSSPAKPDATAAEAHSQTCQSQYPDPPFPNTSDTPASAQSSSHTPTNPHNDSNQSPQILETSSTQKSPSHPPQKILHPPTMVFPRRGGRVQRGLDALFRDSGLTWDFLPRDRLCGGP